MSFLVYPQARSHRLTCWILSLLAWALFGAFLLTYVLYWHSIGGDASIYLPYAQWMFRAPFSFGVEGHVAYGASSPLWTVFISLFYSPEDVVFLYSVKIANLALFLGSLFLLASSLRIHFLVLFFLTTLDFIGVFNFFMLYENSLILFSIALTTYLIKKEDVSKLLVLTALLPLVRFEFFFIQAACVYVYRSRLTAKLLVWQMIPLLLFFSYMYIHTGWMLPSSVITQFLKNRLEFSTASQKLFPLKNALFNPYSIWFLLFLYLAYFCRDREHQRLFEVSFWALIAMLIVAVMTGANWRYSSGFFALGSIVCAVCVDRWMRQKVAIAQPLAVFSAMGLVLFVWVDGFVKEYKARENHFEGMASIWTKRTVPDMAAQLNPLISPGDRILIYEIQGQYHLNGQAVSLDGVVGGEATPYLFRAALERRSSMGPDFDDFIAQHQFIVLGHGTFGTLFKGTAYDFLNEHSENMAVGEQAEYGPLVFTKIAQNPLWVTKDMKLPETWRAIFQIQTKKASQD